MHINRTKLIYGALLLASAFLTACGGGGGTTAPAATYSVGGTINGLSGTVVLQNNGGDNLTLSATGSFTFSTKIASGSPYNVTVLTQPAGQTCTASSNTGTVAAANITTVLVTCSANTYTIGGSISGLTGTVVLQNNGGNSLTRSATGSFVFTTPVASGGGYAVTVLTQPAGQRCTVTNGSGTNVLANVSNVAVDCINVYTISATVTGLGTPPSVGMVLKNNGNNNLSITDNGTFAFSNGLASGESYNVRVLIQPAAPAKTCTVTGGDSGTGSGTVVASAVNVTVACVTPVPSYAYVANYNSNDVSAYSIDPVTGVLTSAGPTVAAGTGPQSVTVVPSGKFAYVASITSNDISAYAIDAGTGVLTPIDADAATAGVQNFAAGIHPVSVTVDSSGQFAYVANLNNVPPGNRGDISAYAINPTTGALTQINCTGGVTVCNGNNFLAGTGPSSVTVDHDGRFAYVANADDNSVSAYTIDAVSGALTQVLCGGSVTACGVVDPADPATTHNGDNFLAGNGPRSLDIDPTSRFVYVANANDNSVAAYTINAATGALTLASCGAPGPSCNASGHFLAGTTPTSIVVDRTGKFVFVANIISGNISAYSIANAAGGTGALTALASSPISAGTSPTSITVDLSGKFVYVANYDSADVSAYSMSTTTGALSPIAGSPFAAGTNPASVVTTIVY